MHNSEHPAAASRWKLYFIQNKKEYNTTLNGDINVTSARCAVIQAKYIENFLGSSQTKLHLYICHPARYGAFNFGQNCMTLLWISS